MSRQCLIVRGGWPGHDPVGATELFIPSLRRQGFVVDVEETPEVYSDESTMARYDLIVQCITMGSATVDEVDGLRRAVASGIGFAGWHGGIIDSFRNATDYLQMVGVQFAAHPHAPQDRGHLDVEPYRDYTVHVRQPEHPIMDGISDFDIRTEQYWVLADGLNEVLADCELVPGDGDEWAKPVTMPVAWTRQWGAGRIFATSLGHTVDVLQRPDVSRLIKRGMDWAAR
ncbi:ThuA domain-containing protein [Demequina sp. NBRC 110056]|uniref:ThuA domain-containing protein n=1 Tax=Demequina sp. NBRC 110056 TaxID=1570345 RepID=UPI001F1CF0E9|nr:ThuA domain-containing protein [Demequina sp. NBRC 110056]